MKKLDEMEIGDRFLADDKAYRPPASHLPHLPSLFIKPLPHLSVFTITERTDDTIIAVNASGVTLKMIRSAASYLEVARWYCEPSRWNYRELDYCEELPTGDDEQIARYCAPRVIDSKPSLFHVDTVNDAEISATLVDLGAPTPILENSGVEWTGETVGAASFYSEPVRLAFDQPLAVAPGDLITCANLRCDVIDGILITTLKQAIVIGSFPDRAAVGAFCAPSTTTPHQNKIYPSDYFVHFDRFLTAKRYGEARAEPSEALVLWWSPDDEKKGETTCHFLGHTGIDFLICEDGIEDYFYNVNLKPGLYLAFNGHAWSDISYEGEHDAGIDADWRPATMEDIERFGFTLACLDSEIADIAEIDARPGLAAEYMAVAPAN